MNDNLLPKNYNGVVEQVIRPTGLLDPVIDVRPALSSRFDNLKSDLIANNFQNMSVFEKGYKPSNQIDDLLNEVRITIKKNQRILVTTLTKRMAEELTNFMMELNIAVQYLHSDIDTIERVEILRDLRKGKYDVVVGINLLREGLDLPEVSLVAILDADKEGFLRSNVSLVQTIGRAARHSEGRVIMYADRITDSMKNSILETMRRRNIQIAHNLEHGITPTSIQKEIKEHVIRLVEKEEEAFSNDITNIIKKAESHKMMTSKERKQLLSELDLQMKISADMLEFEMAAKIRDIIDNIKGKK